MKGKGIFVLSCLLLIVSAVFFFQGSTCAPCGCDEVECVVTLNIQNTNSFELTFKYIGRSVKLPANGTVTVVLEQCHADASQQMVLPWNVVYINEDNGIEKTYKSGSNTYPCGTEQLLIID